MWSLIGKYMVSDCSIPTRHGEVAVDDADQCDGGVEEEGPVPSKPSHKLGEELGKR